eukprot:619175-Amphidinium_carterae.1
MFARTLQGAKSSPGKPLGAVGRSFVFGQIAYDRRAFCKYGILPPYKRYDWQLNFSNPAQDKQKLAKTSKVNNCYS